MSDEMVYAFDGSQLPECACPACERRVNAASKFDGEPTARPAPGDFSVCLGCGSFLRFTEQLTLRLMSEQEVGEIEDEQRNGMLRMRRLIEQLYEPPGLACAVRRMLHGRQA